MAKTTKKTVIGLTGNIATGKSVVRKMLEHLGAYTIDADAITHRILAQDGPGYQAVIDQFGKFILSQEGQIDRTKLGALVFSDPKALASLEAIVHPYVRKAVEYLIERASQEVIVLEAIKLLESPLLEKTDVVWVTTSSEQNQLTRLVSKRGMSLQQARQRMESQAPQAIKAAQADTLIKNDGDFEDTWRQVQSAWQLLFPKAHSGDTVVMKAVPQPVAAQADLSHAELMIDRAKPSQAQDIADFINRLSAGKNKLTRMDVMATFGEKAYMVLAANDQMVGLVGWQVENLVTRIDEVWLEKGLNRSAALAALLGAIEKASKELQAEAALAFVPSGMASDRQIWLDIGYEERTIDALKVTAWQEAARESQHPDTLLLFKQLRIDRVLRPL